MQTDLHRGLLGSVDRAATLIRLKALAGCDLCDPGTRSGVTIWKGEHINKGWAGHTIERHLGLPLNLSRSPNFGSWKLKVVSVRRLPDGTIKVKETMAITMIDPIEVAAKEFPDSHLFLKLQRMIVVAREFESQAETRSLCHWVAEFDPGDRDLYEQVRSDYDLIRNVIRTRGFRHLSGSKGALVRPRTKRIRSRQHIPSVLRVVETGRKDYRYHGHIAAGARRPSQSLMP